MVVKFAEKDYVEVVRSPNIYPNIVLIVKLMCIVSYN